MKFIKPAWLTHSGMWFFNTCSNYPRMCAMEAETVLGLTFALFAPRHLGEQKDFEVYSCHVSPDGSRLATAAGGKRIAMEIEGELLSQA
jgi:hypothetical protein